MIALSKTQMQQVNAAAATLRRGDRKQFLFAVSRRLAAVRRIPSDHDVAQAIAATIGIVRVFPTSGVHK
jgi:hypothetical protein